MSNRHLPTAAEMLRRAGDDLDRAYRALGDAADTLRRGGHRGDSALTDAQEAARTALWRGIQEAAEAINRAKREADR